MRVTRKMLRNSVFQLNYVLGRPLRAWQERTEGHDMKANVGHYQINANAPGDGWTRYTLCEIVSEGGGESNISECLTGQEMWIYLQGV